MKIFRSAEFSWNYLKRKVTMGIFSLFFKEFPLFFLALFFFFFILHFAKYVRKGITISMHDLIKCHAPLPSTNKFAISPKGGHALGQNSFSPYRMHTLNRIIIQKFCSRKIALNNSSSEFYSCAFHSFYQTPSID